MPALRPMTALKLCVASLYNVSQILSEHGAPILGSLVDMTDARSRPLDAISNAQAGP